ncbi:hypothetical protein DFH94DRAFT_265819 [Russula ochroleuca]|uniref:Uncharacterized protein n=1 Tax=Russula ochroleuca TaxID=152965 RepID=A0A9P5N3K0_9AGAM|nr:hypothetical protein DFH94DRAFT_265819 [Russula ochroleuca]
MCFEPRTLKLPHRLLPISSILLQQSLALAIPRLRVSTPPIASAVVTYTLYISVTHKSRPQITSIPIGLPELHSRAQRSAASVHKWTARRTAKN